MSPQDSLSDARVSGWLFDSDPLKVVVFVEEAGGRYGDRNGGKDLELPDGLFTNSRVDAELDEFLTA